MTPAWLGLTVRAEEGLREALALLLVGWGANGVVEVEGGFTAYYPPAARGDLEERLTRYAADVAGAVAWTWSELPTEDWWDSWKVHFRPTRVSEHLAVCPTWEEGWKPEAAGVRVIRMDPGRAFGTGTHETTRLCLRLVDEFVSARPDGSVLDVGCGSGILSVGASLLGAPRVVALDVDPVAASATRENARLNGVDERVHVVAADLRALGGCYDLVVANILYQVLLGLAPLLAARLSPEGRLILSGMLVPELPSARRVYAGVGLMAEREIADGEWGALVLRRSEANSSSCARSGQ